MKHLSTAGPPAARRLQSAALQYHAQEATRALTGLMLAQAHHDAGGDVSADDARSLAARVQAHALDVTRAAIVIAHEAAHGHPAAIIVQLPTYCQAEE